MSMNYERVAEGLPKTEAAKYETGIGLINEFANSLRRKNLLPQEFAKSEVSTALRLPEGAMQLPDLTIGGKTPQQLEEALASGGFRVSDYARDLLRSRDFTTLPEEQVLKLARIKVSDLGLTGNLTTDEVYTKAQSLGLELCPAEVGPQLRLAYKQPLNEWLYIGMPQITDSNGHPNVFRLDRRGDGSWLHGGWARSDSQWRPKSEFVFSVGK